MAQLMYTQFKISLLLLFFSCSLVYGSIISPRHDRNWNMMKSPTIVKKLDPSTSNDSSKMDLISQTTNMTIQPKFNFGFHLGNESDFTEAKINIFSKISQKSNVSEAKEILWKIRNKRTAPKTKKKTTVKTQQKKKITTKPQQKKKTPVKAQNKKKPQQKPAKSANTNKNNAKNQTRPKTTKKPPSKTKKKEPPKVKKVKPTPKPTKKTTKSIKTTSKPKQKKTTIKKVLKNKNTGVTTAKNKITKTTHSSSSLKLGVITPISAYDTKVHSDKQSTINHNVLGNAKISNFLAPKVKEMKFTDNVESNFEKTSEEVTKNYYRNAPNIETSNDKMNHEFSIYKKTFMLNVGANSEKSNLENEKCTALTWGNEKVNIIFMDIIDSENDSTSDNNQQTFEEHTDQRHARTKRKTELVISGEKEDYEKMEIKNELNFRFKRTLNDPLKYIILKRAKTRRISERKTAFNQTGNESKSNKSDLFFPRNENLLAQESGDFNLPKPPLQKEHLHKNGEKNIEQILKNTSDTNMSQTVFPRVGKASFQTYENFDLPKPGQLKEHVQKYPERCKVSKDCKVSNESQTVFPIVGKTSFQTYENFDLPKPPQLKEHVQKYPERRDWKVSNEPQTDFPIVGKTSFQTYENFDLPKPPLLKEHRQNYPEPETTINSQIIFPTVGNISEEPCNSSISVKRPIQKDSWDNYSDRSKEWVAKNIPKLDSYLDAFFSKIGNISQDLNTRFIIVKAPEQIESDHKYADKNYDPMSKKTIKMDTNEDQYRTQKNNPKLSKKTKQEERISRKNLLHDFELKEFDSNTYNSSNTSFANFSDFIHYFSKTFLKTRSHHILLLSEKFDPVLSEISDIGEFLSIFAEEPFQFLTDAKNGKNLNNSKNSYAADKPRFLKIIHFVSTNRGSTNSLEMKFKKLPKTKTSNSKTNDSSHFIPQEFPACVSVPVSVRSTYKILIPNNEIPNSTFSRDLTLFKSSDLSLLSRYKKDFRGTFILQLKKPEQQLAATPQEKFWKKFLDKSKSTSLNTKVTSINEPSVGIDYWIPEEAFEMPSTSHRQRNSNIQEINDDDFVEPDDNDNFPQQKKSVSTKPESIMRTKEGANFEKIIGFKSRSLSLTTKEFNEDDFIEDIDNSTETGRNLERMFRLKQKFSTFVDNDSKSTELDEDFELDETEGSLLKNTDVQNFLGLFKLKQKAPSDARVSVINTNNTKNKLNAKERFQDSTETARFEGIFRLKQKFSTFVDNDSKSTELDEDYESDEIEGSLLKSTGVQNFHGMFKLKQKASSRANPLFTNPSNLRTTLNTRYQMRNKDADNPSLDQEDHTSMNTTHVHNFLELFRLKQNSHANEILDVTESGHVLDYPEESKLYPTFEGIFRYKQKPTQRYVTRK